MTTIDDKFNQLGTSILNLVRTRASKNLDNLSEIGLNNLIDIADEATSRAMSSGYVSRSSLSEAQCVIQTYQNGNSWCRVWSDGWCEQGGVLIPTNVNNDTVSLIQTYRDPSYHILFGNMYKNATATATSCAYAASKTASSFVVYNSTDTAFYTYWYTCGYLY